MKHPPGGEIELDGFPGVTVKVQRMPHLDGTQVRARLIVYSMQMLLDDVMERVPSPEMLIANACESVAEQSLLYAAALALPFVGLDWSKLIQLGMIVVDEKGRRGTVEFVDKTDSNNEKAAINWAGSLRADMNGGEVFGFQDILERLEDRRWRLA